MTKILMLVTSIRLHPYLIFEGKSGAYPSGAHYGLGHFSPFSEYGTTEKLINIEHIFRRKYVCLLLSVPP